MVIWRDILIALKAPEQNLVIPQAITKLYSASLRAGI